MSGMEIPALVAAGSAVAGTATSIYGQQMAGSEAKRSAEFEAQQYERRARQFETQAAQDETARRRELQSSLDTIEVIRSGRGLNLDSPTGRAIAESVREGAERDIGIAKGNIIGQAAQSELAAGETRRKGRYSMLAADVGSLTTLASGVGKLATAGRYPATR